MSNSTKFLILLVLTMTTLLFGESLVVAIPTAIEGKITYLRDNDTWNDIQLNMPLFEGDQIQLSKDASVSLLFKKGKQEILKGKMIYTIPAKLEIDVTPSKVFVEIWNSMVEKFKNSYSEKRLETYPGIRGESIVLQPGKIVSPFETKVSGTNPVFIWTTDKTISNNEITLYKDAQEIWSSEVNNPNYSIPNSETFLENGSKYSWTLTSKITMGVQITETTQFEIIDFQELEMINLKIDEIDNSFVYNADCGAAVLYRALVYEKAGLFADALSLYLDYVKKMNHSPNAVLILADFYYERGFPELAVNELLKAIEIPDELKNRW